MQASNKCGENIVADIMLGNSLCLFCRHRLTIWAFTRRESSRTSCHSPFHVTASVSSPAASAFAASASAASAAASLTIGMRLPLAAGLRLAASDLTALCGRRSPSEPAPLISSSTPSMSSTDASLPGKLPLSFFAMAFETPRPSLRSSSDRVSRSVPAVRGVGWENKDRS